MHCKRNSRHCIKAKNTSTNWQAKVFRRVFAKLYNHVPWEILATRASDVWQLGCIRYWRWTSRWREKNSEAFNEQFKSVFTVDDNIIPNFDANYPPVPDVVISETGILNMLLKLDVKKSPGPDDTPNAFLKDMQNGHRNTCVFFLLNLCAKGKYRTTRELPEWNLYIRAGEKTASRTVVPSPWLARHVNF